MLISFYGKMVINTFAVSNENEGSIGTAMYLSASSLNHSCDPNCAIVFNGAQMSIKVIKEFDIAKEEPTISYTEMLLTRKQRQDYLLKHYYFKCQCTRCESLENQDALVKCTKCNSYSIRLKDSLISSCELNECNLDNPNELIDLIKQIESITTTSGLSDKTTNKTQLIERVQTLASQVEAYLSVRSSVYCVQLYELLMDLFVETNEFRRAYLIAINQLYEAYKFHLSRFHPKREVFLVKLVKLGLHLGELKEIQTYLKEAQLIVRTNRECDSSLYKELDELTFEINNTVFMSPT